MKKINLTVTGCLGRMGQQIIKSSIRQKSFKLVSITENLIEFIFLSILSFSVLATIKIVGGLLVTSIILIPAMSARIISSSPLMMIILSIFFAQIMNVLGIILSFHADLPFAPTIILCGGGIFIMISIYNKIK